jgi:hypothetical protein
MAKRVGGQWWDMCSLLIMLLEEFWVTPPLISYQPLDHCVSRVNIIQIISWVGQPSVGPSKLEWAKTTWFMIATDNNSRGSNSDIGYARYRSVKKKVSRKCFRPNREIFWLRIMPYEISKTNVSGLNLHCLYYAIPSIRFKIYDSMRVRITKLTWGYHFAWLQRNNFFFWIQNTKYKIKREHMPQA